MEDNVKVNFGKRKSSSVVLLKVVHATENVSNLVLFRLNLWDLCIATDVRSGKVVIRCSLKLKMDHFLVLISVLKVAIKP